RRRGGAEVPEDGRPSAGARARPGRTGRRRRHRRGHHEPGCGCHYAVAGLPRSRRLTVSWRACQRPNEPVQTGARAASHAGGALPPPSEVRMSDSLATLSRPAIPPEAQEFAAEKGVSRYLNAVIDLARQAFPSSALCVSLGQDAEDETHQYIAIDVEVGR